MLIIYSCELLSKISKYLLARKKFKAIKIQKPFATHNNNYKSYPTNLTSNNPTTKDQAKKKIKIDFPTRALRITAAVLPFSSLKPATPSRKSRSSTESINHPAPAPSPWARRSSPRAICEFLGGTPAPSRRVRQRRVVLSSSAP